MELKAPSLKPLFGFVSLLFYADPTWLDKLMVVVAFFAAIGAGVPVPVTGIIFGQLVDDINQAACDTSTPATESQSAINKKVLTLLYLAIGRFFLIFIHIACWNLSSQRLSQRIRERYVRSLLKQDIAYFDKLPAGEVSSRLNGDIQAIQTATCEKVGIFLNCISFGITAYIIAFILQPKLAGMLIALIPAFVIMNLATGHFTQKYTIRVSNHFASAGAIVSEALNNVGLVHALGAQPRLEQSFGERLTNAKRDGLKKATVAATQAGMIWFIALSAQALAYWQGSIRIAQSLESNSNGTTVGKIFTVIFILVDGASNLGHIAPFLPLFGAGVGTFKRLKQEIEHLPTIDGTSESGDKPTDVEGSVELRNVSFAYPARPEHQVLNNVSLQCEAQKLTALVGLSGSGKSTIASLITRFYDPLEGSISLDGKDLKSLNVKSLRGFISLVPQEPSLLDRSILENIALGLVNSPAHAHLEKTLLGDALATIAKTVRDGQDLFKLAESASPEVAEIVRLVQTAAELADVSNFVGRLEHGFATPVGSSGSLISGGQKQRIALARALVRNPRILVLDEATAALDSASEQRIQAAIDRASKGRTVISIAHRLSTIKAASKIIVMRQGSIIEEGTHEELMSIENGSYAEMVRLQSVKPAGDDAASSASRSAVDSDDEITEKGKTTNDPDATHALKDKTKDKSTEPKEASAELAATSVKRAILPFLRPYPLLLTGALFCSLLVGLTFTAAGLIFGDTIGSFSPCNEPDYIRSRGLLLSGMYFMLACVEFLANFGSWQAFGIVSERLIYKIRILSFRSLFQQPLEWHESEGRSPNKLLTYITNDGNSLAGFSGSIVGTVFSVVINFLSVIVLTHVLAWRIAIVCLTLVPLSLGAGYMQWRGVAKFAVKHAGAFSSSIGITVEALTNIRTVAALSLEEEILLTYRRSLKAPRQEMVRQSFNTTLWLSICNAMPAAIYAFSYWWGSKNIIEGRYSPSDFFTIVVSLMVSAQLWGQFFVLAPEISKARGAMSRIFGLIELGSKPKSKVSSAHSGDSSSKSFDDDMHEKGDIESVAESPSIPSRQGGATVAFRDVSFSYPARPNIPVLDSLSLSIRPGQFCALAGPSGAGKSTVLALLERFYEPTSGVVSINGFDISRHNSAAFRDDIAYVPQENVMFQGTVRFNLTLGARPGHTPTDAELEEACKLANIHDVIIGLPKGYDTDVGANGSQLSGGQRQRLSIARALIRKPNLLLLDESTSALDAESENALEMGLERAVKGQGITVIAIAHRLRTIAKADVIFLIEGGRVVDQGRHSELVERCESYRVNALHQMMA
ncbi:leptomycin B resistance protein pmd1 [Aaosphaeria arxii CBS 175.79]|uniref:Leptomycin B resistance protein pmd1 n=1 Tax=Aaosphaeria arxii CBS 175.79 TaxID=1450172 RepID=A0A6A5Y6C0_9PLEO|nr:leptomycin B resistance protein pmd1 [Aaosphaeria arxii CBS 175.79]KAF2021068.1 leptomycin B resistance protein pmd1 [Aaosphaeria arxii CBS 175.79]